MARKTSVYAQHICVFFFPKNIFDFLWIEFTEMEPVVMTDGLRIFPM